MSLVARWFGSIFISDVKLAGYLVAEGIAVVVNRWSEMERYRYYISNVQT